MVKNAPIRRTTHRLADLQPLDDKSQSPVLLHIVPEGSYGSENYSGYAQEEYLQALRGSQRSDIFDKMRRSDPQVIMLVSAVKNPIKSANWEVQPASDDAQDVRIKDFVEHVLFRGMDQPFQRFLSEALSCVEFGHSVFEITDKVVLNDPEFGNYNAIKDLSFRSQRTIERWNLEDITGKLKSISQYAYGDLGRLVDISEQFLVVFSVGKEGANYEGISMLRPCYGNWIRKNEILKNNIIGIEKFAVPTPLVQLPEGVHAGSPSFSLMKQALEAYANSEGNYLIYPSGYQINLNTNTYDPQKVEASINFEDERMTRAFLANFLSLGQGGTGGAYALSNDLSDFFLSGIEHVANEIACTLNMKVIPRLVKMNFGELKKYPELKVSGISDKAGKELADILSSMAARKIITPDDKLEEHLRKRLALPEMSDEGKRDVDPPQSFGFDESPLTKRIRAAERARLGKKKK